MFELTLTTFELELFTCKHSCGGYYGGRKPDSQFMQTPPVTGHQPGFKPASPCSEAGALTCMSSCHKLHGRTLIPDHVSSLLRSDTEVSFTPNVLVQ